MILDRPNLGATPFEAARSIVLGYLEQARRAAPRLDDESDGEALHDFRVAVRRLRTTLRAWRRLFVGVVPKAHARAWADLHRSTGAGRDAQVAMSWIDGERESAGVQHHAGIDLVNATLDARFQRAMTAAGAGGRGALAVLEAELSALLDGPAPPSDSTFADVLVTEVCRCAQRFSRALRRVRKRRQRKRIHELRLSCKRLRYLLEPLDGVLDEVQPVIEHCRALQGLLGDLNDAFVLRTELTAVLDGWVAGPIVGERDGVDELMRRVKRREKKLFRSLRRSWLDTGAAPLLESVGELVGRLAIEARDAFEIERKYLLNALPERVRARGGATRVYDIEQGWLPGERFRERYRRKAANDRVQYTRTIKLGTGLRRVEIEENISRKRFEKAWPKTEGRRVSKRRYVIAEGDHEWELDEFLDRDLLLAEVELADEKERVEMPAWLAPHVVREVTGEPAYVNLNLAR